MEKVVVSQQTHPAFFRQCKSLGQLIACLEKMGEKDDQYIVKILLNGRKLDNDEEQLLESLSINEVDELAVHFSSIDEITGKTMISIIGSIQDIQLNVIKFTKEFRGADQIDDEKLKFILIQCRGVIEGLEEIFKTHSSGKLMLKHFSLWVEAEKELTNILQCILQSRSLNDVEFISDLLEFDLVQALSLWEEVLEKEMHDSPTISQIFSLNSRLDGSDNGVDV
ncbi:MAG: hypothetical protein KDD33_01240 [Bdellovibrionales bacterium]|nr:hypothetical protein [Bdellovibrionales bacterium]